MEGADTDWLRMLSGTFQGDVGGYRSLGGWDFLLELDKNKKI